MAAAPVSAMPAMARAADAAATPPPVGDAVVFAAPVEAPIPVLFEDAWLAVVDKPAGLMAHASALARGEDDFLVDRLRAQFGRPVHLVHRLDRATSGCLLVAFDAATAAQLGAVFMDRDVRKDYLAICRGWLEPAQQLLDYPLDGGPGKPLRKPAITGLQRLAVAEVPWAGAAHETSRYSLLLCTPQTGRFRQIRRHLKHLSHHLVGDSGHGDGRHNRHFRMRGVHRMLLHAWRLRFAHPRSGDALEVVAPPDAGFLRALELLGIPRPDPRAFD